MDRIQSVVLIDGAMRRRAAISRKLRNGGKHVEPFESISALTLVWPHSGLVLAHDEGGTIGALVAQMGSTGTWLPVIAYAESPSPDRVARAILAGAIGGIDVLKMMLTYCVPYCVSTHASVQSIRSFQRSVVARPIGKGD